MQPNSYPFYPFFNPLLPLNIQTSSFAFLPPPQQFFGFQQNRMIEVPTLQNQRDEKPEAQKPKRSDLHKQKTSSSSSGKKQKHLMEEAEPKNRKTDSDDWKSREKNHSKVIEQKVGRNSNSNLLRMFFRRLEYKLQQAPTTLLSIIGKYKLNITLEEFVSWFQTNKVDFRNYIRIHSVKRLFVDHRFAKEQTQIMRILLKDFLHKEALICFITSKKAKRGVVAHNLINRRSIIDEILDQCISDQ